MFLLSLVQPLLVLYPPPLPLYARNFLTMSPDDVRLFRNEKLWQWKPFFPALPWLMGLQLVTLPLKAAALRTWKKWLPPYRFFIYTSTNTPCLVDERNTTPLIGILISFCRINPGATHGLDVYAVKLCHCVKNPQGHKKNNWCKREATADQENHMQLTFLRVSLWILW